MKIRKGLKEELSTIFMMGFDAWHEGLGQEEYLEICLNSPKYPNGQWWVLEDEGEPVSSLIVYQDCFELPEGCQGIGSVATPPPLRGRGYAPVLINHVIDSAREDDARGIYLFTGVGTEYYGQFGFECVEVERPEASDPCMVLAFRDAEELRRHVPGFF